jgi:site-specific DNA-methyltransferase (adenine-specific)
MLGDCLIKLKKLADNSVDSIVTDPPYGLNFMGKAWDYDVPNEEIWRECLRVLKPGGHLLAFFGTRTYHRGVVRIEDAGFEIRDQIQWIYGSGFPKSHNIKEGDFKGWGTALKPANEPIVVARKPLEKGLTVAENVLKWGTGAINIDGCRIATDDNLGREVRQTQSWKNTSTAGVGSVNDDWKQGRWPANIMFDEEAAAMLGEPSRFFYVAKASKSERNEGLEGMPLVRIKGQPSFLDEGGFANATKKPILNQNHHPTVKPIKLMQYLIKLVTPPNGTTLDPFMGSGSTGVAAKKLGFDFIGIEMNEEYFEIAKRRIENVDDYQLEML